MARRPRAFLFEKADAQRSLKSAALLAAYANSSKVETYYRSMFQRWIASPTTEVQIDKGKLCLEQDLWYKQYAEQFTQASQGSGAQLQQFLDKMEAKSMHFWEDIHYKFGAARDANLQTRQHLKEMINWTYRVKVACDVGMVIVGGFSGLSLLAGTAASQGYSIACDWGTSRADALNADLVGVRLDPTATDMFFEDRRTQIVQDIGQSHLQDLTSDWLARDLVTASDRAWQQYYQAWGRLRGTDPGRVAQALGNTRLADISLRSARNLVNGAGVVIGLLSMSDDVKRAVAGYCQDEE